MISNIEEKSSYLENLPAIRELFALTFKREIPESFLRWRYAENIFNQTLVTVAKSDQAIVSHYASTPVEWVIRKSPDPIIIKVMGGMVASVMTHPEFGGQGLFQRLSLANDVLLRKQGFAFAFAFPNKNSHPIFINKLDWKPVFEIPTLFLDLGLDCAASAPSPDLIIIFDHDFSKFDYDSFTSRDGLICVHRTTAYLKWRYFHHPTQTYRNMTISDGNKLMSYGVFKTYESGSKRYLDLVDFFSADANSLEKLLSSLISVAISESCTGINTWTPAHHWSADLLLAKGFLKSSTYTYFDFKCFDASLCNHLNSFSNWWITMGDSDVY